MPTAVILGSSGLVGRACLQAILQSGAYGEIRAVVRRPLALHHPSLREVQTELSRLEEHAELFRTDAVFCCLGTTIKKAGSRPAFRLVDFDAPVAAGRLAVRGEVRQFLIVTALGADSRSRVFYSRVKGEVEEELGRLGLPELHIFRPSLLLGEREELRLGESIAAPLMKAAGRLLPPRFARYRPVEAAVVGRAMAAVALGLPGAPGVSSRAARRVYESDEIQEIGGRSKPLPD